MDYAGGARSGVASHCWRMLWGGNVSAGRRRLPPGGVGREKILEAFPVYGFEAELRQDVRIVRLVSDDATNRLTRAVVRSLTEAIRQLANDKQPLIFTGNE